VRGAPGNRGPYRNSVRYLLAGITRSVAGPMTA
jgi:hypothetical protein